MQAFFAFLNEPMVLWGLLIGGAALVLIDYFFPVDWPAFGGYFAIALFAGATAPLGPAASLGVIVAAFTGLLVLHLFVLTHFLTNSPKYEVSNSEQASASVDASPSPPPESES